MPATPNGDLTLSEQDRCVLIPWAIDCVRRVLPLFEHVHPEDTRLGEGIAGALRFADGQLPIGAARTLAFGCHAAARESTDEAARAVARACGQAVAVAHMGGHARNVPTYVLKALRADGAAAHDLAAEGAWQRSRVPAALASYVYPA